MTSNRFEPTPYKPLAITAVVFAVLLPPVGIILAVIARVLQRKAGFDPDVLTTIALALGVLVTLGAIVLAMSFLVGFATIA
ncbi:MAG: hypothetical protein LBB58_00615 [Cellulomonadaceae bacterium]|jgi:hypothetical protein|nr:hypothetical protein [Cellulomonadaceae bacterium]